MNIVIFGDSICVGQCINPHETWVHSLSNFLATDYASISPQISNVSKSGDTTRLALDRMKYQVSTSGVEVFYTQFGLNDANYWADEAGLPRSLPETFSANLYEILMRAQAWGAITLLVGTNHPVPPKGEKQWPSGIMSYTDCVMEYNERARAVAKRAGAFIVDHEQYWLRNHAHLSQNLLPDGVHLSVEGHKLYSNLIQPTFANIAKDRIPA